MNDLKRLSIKLQVLEIKEKITEIANSASEQFSPESCLLNDENDDHWLNSKIIFGIDCRRWLCGFCGKPFEN